jgi:Tol biopolymer transport system component
LLSVVAPDPETEVHSIFLLRPDGGEPLQLTRGIEVRGPSPEFAATDTHILFTSFRSDPELGLIPDIWMVPLPTGTPVPLIESASAATTSPDGRELAYASVTPRGTSIRVRHQDGSEIEVAHRGFWPRWSPDGEWIAYTTSNPEGGQGTLHIVRPDGTSHRQLTSIHAQYYGLCWTSDSARVIFACDRDGPTALWSVDTDGDNLESVTHGPGICSTPTMSTDGRRLVFTFDSRRWHFHLADTVDGQARRVLDLPGVRSAALSPDGSSIALALGEEAQSPAVSVFDLSTGRRRTLSGMAALEVAWMPDGEGLVMSAPAPDGTTSWVWQLELAGGLPRPIMTGAVDWRSPRPSPDGSRIAAIRGTGNGMELVVKDLDHGTEQQVARNPVIEAPRWSPDGQ